MGGILFSLEEGEQEVWDGWMDGWISRGGDTHSFRFTTTTTAYSSILLHPFCNTPYKHRYTVHRFLSYSLKDDIVLFLMVTISFTRKMGGCCGC